MEEETDVGVRRFEQKISLVNLRRIEFLDHNGLSCNIRRQLDGTDFASISSLMRVGAGIIFAPDTPSLSSSRESTRTAQIKQSRLTPNTNNLRPSCPTIPYSSSV